MVRTRRAAAPKKTKPALDNVRVIKRVILELYRINKV